MYIIVVGGGRLGYYLTKALLSEGHEVLIVEKNAAICERIVDELGSVCIRGDGCEMATLAEIGTVRADMLIAVTGDDEDNLVACQVAKHKFNVPHTIARVRNPKNETIFKKLGIDVTVSSTNIILENIEAEVPTHPLIHLLTIRDKGLEIVEVKIPPDSTTVGKPVKELSLPQGSRLALIIPKEHKPRVPTSDTILRDGDRVIAVTTPESEEELRAALRGA
ncbi:MAG: TrkA family potassium uptake protein [Dehalococcoidia bacterium]|nr:MAG: TrkA family potassium uptake protein [Dehalococcoidia bacterium]